MSYLIGAMYGWLACLVTIYTLANNGHFPTCVF